MKHIRKRITGIIDELITYFFNMGATNIKMDLKEKKDSFEIFLKCNYSTKNNDKINKLIKHLKSEKQSEIEEYYWELAGSSDAESELALVGMMIDDAQINVMEDTIEMILHKNK